MGRELDVATFKYGRNAISINIVEVTTENGTVWLQCQPILLVNAYNKLVMPTTKPVRAKDNKAWRRTWTPELC